MKKDRNKSMLLNYILLQYYYYFTDGISNIGQYGPGPNHHTNFCHNDVGPTDSGGLKPLDLIKAFQSNFIFRFSACFKKKMFFWCNCSLIIIVEKKGPTKISSCRAQLGNEPLIRHCFGTRVDRHHRPFRQIKSFAFLA